MLNYNTFEVILYWGLFAFGFFASIYWPANQSIAGSAFLLVAFFGYSKMHRIWLLEDEIEQLNKAKKVRDINDMLVRLRSPDSLPISLIHLRETGIGRGIDIVAYTAQGEDGDQWLKNTKDVQISTYDSPSEIAEKIRAAYQS